MPEKPEKVDIIPPLNTKVSPDSQNIKAESQGFKEDLAIAEWLINSKSYAEGNNGLIRTINTANIPPFLIDGNSEPISPDNAVVKLLKIYEPAQGQKEFERQTKASELLVGRDTAHYAQTPRAFLHRTIHISDPVLIFRLKEKQFPVGRLPEIKINPNVAESLGMDKKKKYNWDTVTEKEVKIFWENGYLRDLQSEMFFILMDFIPGKDLGRIIYEQIALLDADVKDHLQRLNLTPDAASFVDLQKAVAQKFFYRTQNNLVSRI